jgi:hypothetical protein
MKSRKIIRLKGYDYSNDGWYFVTIEPNDRQYPFCKILDGKIFLNEIGKIIDERWRWLFLRYDHIKMDEYIIMPDHFHGIIRILPKSDNECADDGAKARNNVRATLESPFPLREAPEPPIHLAYNHKRLPLPRILGAFKTTASKRIHEAGYHDFKWKRSFHDRIIREDEIEIKRAYIKNNPKIWKINMKYFPANSKE